ncbi:hypothetical protein SBOR_6006 [Sclerotinia borealis F-4128]|uniref:Protein kinase domain-containing protein n=1 Tax=Sclerotinia borealis (strain F-4128) TaxID=1432307 RepID=W9CCS1_SCLBF|nr:hypothetical protein SBOR_6006 [Sclerotinia borealis F-4128]
MGDYEECGEFQAVCINAGDDEGADITFEYNGKRITVSLFASSSCQASGNSQHENYIEDRLIRLLNQAVTADDEDYDELVDEASDVILGLGKILFSQVAPPLPVSILSDQDLHSHLYPKTLNFRLETVDNKAVIFPISPDDTISLPDTAPDPDLETDFQADSIIPQYSSREVIIQRVFASGNNTVSKVQVGSQTMLCKAHRAGLQDPNLKQELVSVQKIREAGINSRAQIRVPSLQGYVRHADSGAIIGLLRDFILSGVYGGTLRDVDVSAVPKEMRRKWANQIRETVDELHEAGVVWGDGKASNVVMDQSDNAWLIDFAGGWSKGWVDEELAGSKEGDKQAVRKISEFLSVA